MILLQQITASSTSLRFALNLAAASFIVVALGWSCACLCRRRPVPLQHGILVSIVSVMACSPLLLLASQAFGWGLLSIEMAEETPPVETFHDTDRESPKTVDGTTAVADGRPAGDATASESLAGGKVRAQTGGTVRSGIPVWVAVGCLASGIWGLGIIVGLIIHAKGLLAIRRFRRSLGAATCPDLSELLQSVLGPEAGMRRISVYVSPLTSAPISLGLFHPIIVVPEYLAAVNSKPLRLVLRHEAAHILRGDHWVALLQQWAAIVYWWNPFMHLVNRRLRHLRELICDDHAAENRTEGRLLAETLVGVAERSVTPQLRGAAALVENEARALEARVRRLLERSAATATRMSAFDRSVAAAFVLLLASLLIAGNVRAAGKPKPEVTVHVFRDNGAPARNVEVVPVTIGYYGGRLQPTDLLRADDTGTLNVPSGSVYAARPDSDRPVFFTPDHDRERLQVRLPRPEIWARHVPQQSRSEQLRIDVDVENDRGRDLLTVRLTNDSGFALSLTKADLSIFSSGWRVFPPDSEQRGGMNISGHGGTATLHLDWDSYVRSGMWCRREADDDGGRELDERGDPRMYVRISIAGVSSAPFPVTRPEDVSVHNRPALSAEELGVSGRWLLTLPAGFKHRITITPLGRNRYRLTPGTLNMSGIYTVRDRQLRMLEPNDSRLTEFAWESPAGNGMLLVDEPPAGKTGSSYLGATLTRQQEDE